jgi:hypothetical protein
MLLILISNMISECPRIDCSRLRDKIKNGTFGSPMFRRTINDALQVLASGTADGRWEES